ncbi:heterokaryon incompatibility protein-domain-containing protein [Hypoxylon sp. NC1633]|nr:heterokaryon incompatibility protein-domain-containing protein [Hypoxylon sp. NC1633]
MKLEVQIRNESMHTTHQLSLSQTEASNPTPDDDALAIFLFLISTTISLMLSGYVETGTMDVLIDYLAMDPLQIMALHWLKNTGRIQYNRETTRLYEDLREDEIRILVLEAGDPDSEISCRLVTCSHGDRLPYDAISYAWGNPANVMAINCNGMAVQIPVNLYNALFWLRKRTEDRLLWIDALCINQEDMEERGDQVQKMATIFSCARKTLVWLRPETKDTKGALYPPVRYDRLNKNVGWMFRAPPGPFGYNFAETEDKRDLLDMDWRPLMRLLEQPWFTRLWVIQEVARARRVTVLLGKTKISWDKLASTVTELHHRGLLDAVNFTEEAARGAEAVIEMQAARERTSHDLQQSLLRLLLATASAECSDIKDKVYAVLSLATDYNPNKDGVSFKPDYSITDGEAFTRVARWAVAKGDLDLLLSCATASDMEGLPSWAPDWSRIENHSPFLRFSDRINFDATRFTSNTELHRLSQPTYPKVEEDDTLILRGVQIDVISDLGPETRFQNTFMPRSLSSHRLARECNIKWIEGCLALANSVLRNTIHERTRWKATVELEKQFRITMTAGMTGEGDSAPQAFQIWVKDYIHWLQFGYPRWIQEETRQTSNNAAARPLPPGLYSDSIAAVESSISMWASKRRFAITSAGRMVLVPQHTSKGDVVMLVEGCRMPYVFRAQEGGMRYYRVIGEAFVADVMDGGFFESICAHEGREKLIRDFSVR